MSTAALYCVKSFFSSSLNPCCHLKQQNVDKSASYLSTVLLHTAIHCVYLIKSHAIDTWQLQNNHTHLCAHQTGPFFTWYSIVHSDVGLQRIINPVCRRSFPTFSLEKVAFHVLFMNGANAAVTHSKIWCDGLWRELRLKSHPIDVIILMASSAFFYCLFLSSLHKLN